MTDLAKETLDHVNSLYKCTGVLVVAKYDKIYRLFTDFNIVEFNRH